MANPFTKAWNYCMALFDSKIDEHADPKVQIQQAIDDAQRRHQELSAQAASVIGNQRQLEMKLNRRLSEIEKLHANTKQALALADKARAEGNSQKAVEYENTAEAFAAQLVSAEQDVEDTKKLHDQALRSAEEAKKAVERNALRLQEQVSERTKLLSQLEQAKMQEKVSESLQSVNALADSSSGPNLEQIREKIESRYATALGQAELAQGSVQGRMAEVEASSLQMAGHSRLEAIRAEMSGELESGAPQSALESGTAPTAEATNSAVADKLRQLREES